MGAFKNSVHSVNSINAEKNMIIQCKTTPICLQTGPNVSKVDKA